MSKRPPHDPAPSDDEEHTASAGDGEPGSDTADGDTNGATDADDTPVDGLKPVVVAPRTRPPRRTGVFLDPDDLRDHVGELLRTILGGYEVDAFGNFTFTHEGARVFVTVGASPVGPQIGVFSVTNLDIDLTPELAGFLLTTNHALGFGSFSYDMRNRAVWLRHTLLGSTIDLPELNTAVAAVASTAAQLDERIRDQFGGRTFQEAPEEMQQRVEPPESRDGTAFPNAGGYL